ncbi:chromosome-associated kinesin KIF4 [Diachasma alloeum]|uniref:chromosome-associated kinesin KIF4 n=1 Tax=Diachasma alloeum TaxID=454923 RepID=UPI0007381514|nr:chromosome-associated kinesin KIF4 [Diachasma alloeum]
MGRAKKEKTEKPAEPEKPKAPKLKKSKKVEEEEEPQAPEEDKDDIIARLQEEVKLLKIEVKTLRKHVKASPQAPDTTAKKKATEAPGTPKGRRSSTASIKPKDKGCSCKGNCSNKICGCVKKDFYCLPTCKCSEGCRNQDPGSDNEDKENKNGETEGEIEVASSPSVFEASPDVLRATENQRGKPAKDSLQEFNPMEPRRQLARSPAPSKAPKDTQKSKPSHPALAEKPLPPPKDEPEEEELPPPEEINVAEVDWEKHKAQLVQCSKCSRNFYAYRLKKHEKSCIKV